MVPASSSPLTSRRSSASMGLAGAIQTRSPAQSPYAPTRRLRAVAWRRAEYRIAPSGRRSDGRRYRAATLRLPMNRYCVENRSPDISTNFYLTAAFSLAAGMDGVEKKADPGAPWNENLYDLVEGRAKPSQSMPERLPRTLIEALDGFRVDPLVGPSLGE